jgi:hypothetical protein
MPASLIRPLTFEEVQADRNVLPLQSVLADRPRDPKWTDMHDLSEYMYEVADAQIAAGVQPSFGDIYATLTGNMADGIDHPGKFSNTRLPLFRQSNELTLQAFHFAETWSRPNQALVDYHLGKISREKAVGIMGPLWAYGMLNRELQMEEPPIYFLCAGMLPHIRQRRDLRDSLRTSDVSMNYLRYRPKGIMGRGDYFKTDDWIEYTADQKIGEMMPGTSSRLRRLNRVITGCIALLRKQTWYDHISTVDYSDEIAKADDVKSDQRALNLAKFLVKRSAIGLNTVSILANGKRYDESRDGREWGLDEDEAA